MRFLFVFLFLMINYVVQAQQFLKGKVQDEVGKPVAEVMIKGSKGVVLGKTDIAGHFNIQVPLLPIEIKSSKIGYFTYSAEIIDTAFITIILKIETIQLEEAIVYNDGFQKLPRERATGSFEQLGGNLLKRRVSSTILGQLEGLATGLQFDNRTKSAQLNIRGLNSFSAGNVQPLIVVDNFPFEGSIDQINPNDVASVTLLKDAAATSIWGARAGNGVIVITMKKANDKSKINFSSNWTLQAPEDLYYDPIISSNDFIDLELFLFEKGHFDNFFTNPLTLRKRVLSPVVDLLQKVKLDEMKEDEANRKIDLWRSLDFRKDREKFYQQATLQQYYVRINGGNARSDHSLSIGWDRKIGNELKRNSDRISLRQNNLFKITDRFQVNADLSYTLSMDNASAGISNYFYYPYTQLFDNNGDSNIVPYMLNQNYVNEIKSKGIMDWTFDPYADLNRSQTKNNLDHFGANFTARYSLLDGLNVQLVYGVEGQSGRNTSFYEESSFFAKNLINQFLEVADDGQVKYILPKGSIQDRSFSSLISHRVRSQLDYTTTWYKDHQFNIILGTELSHRKNVGNSYRNYGVDKDVLTMQKVDYVNAYATYDNLYGNNYIPFYGNNSQNVQRFLSVFANAAYTYRERYTLTGSMRKDGSNMFGAVTNEKWNPLWSVGLAWNLSKEDFMKDFLWLNNLRIRSTYGTSGNIGGGANRDPIMTYSGTAQYTNYQYGLINVPPNPYLKWEEVRTFNNGIDFSILQKRISGSFEWYNKKSIDLIAPDQIDPTTGFGNAYRNIGKISGKGIDTKLDISAPRQSPFQWNATLGFSYTKSVVTYYKGTINSTMNYAESGPQILNPILQKELYPLFAYRFAGLDPENGDPRGYYKGEVSKDYQKILNDSLKNLHYYGSALPSHYGFFRGMVGWKRFQFTFSINYKFGHYFRKSTIGYAGLFNGSAGHGDYYDRWQNPGDELWTEVPSMLYPANGNRDNFYKYSEANVLKGDIIRLQDIRLTYIFPKFPLQFHAGINNVGILWRANRKGLDPDYFSTPPSRIYSFGINVNL
ncbi:hypothetical protein KO02_22255 [Sphingobacterium sp. ML3W]|uniref:SusC/RagA family TonB-linked outer membrane protein n=1 Tax=Sphingobacterium sp. ML3W TaxID=1538644 RepID=UPI0004F6A24D|nr:SusC/RagA family TonB-linked outer membrane protein [Sphingobacterium sp. ML3W]AIM39102.1 hypothetical protein KO02_22255 [Sphingobacterium sp. ML3W]